MSRDTYWSGEMIVEPSGMLALVDYTGGDGNAPFYPFTLDHYGGAIVLVDEDECQFDASPYLQALVEVLVATGFIVTGRFDWSGGDDEDFGYHEVVDGKLHVARGEKTYTPLEEYDALSGYRGVRPRFEEVIAGAHAAMVSSDNEGIFDTT